MHPEAQHLAARALAALRLLLAVLVLAGLQAQAQGEEVAVVAVAVGRRHLQWHGAGGVGARGHVEGALVDATGGVPCCSAGVAGEEEHASAINLSLQGYE